MDYDSVPNLVIGGFHGVLGENGTAGKKRGKQNDG
jgi:hypothetical protein